MLKLLLSILIVGLVGACGGTHPEPMSDSSAAICVEGTAECQGDSVRLCEVRDGRPEWSAASPCSEEAICIAGACRKPSPGQTRQLSSLEQLVNHLHNHIGILDELALDPEQLKQEARRNLLSVDESDQSFIAEAWRLFSLYPSGHNAFYSPSLCGSSQLPHQTWSQLGVCTQPSGPDVIVSFALPDNRLGLVPGDRIISVQGEAGEAMYSAALRRPVCGTAWASPSNRRFAAAVSLLQTLPIATQLQVVSSDGSSRRVEITQGQDQWVACRDPLGRDQRNTTAESWIRPDGVGVIRLTRLLPHDAVQGETREQLEARLEQYIKHEFDKVKHVPALVWDLRANLGGATHSGLKVVNGMPGARTKLIAHCKAGRIPFSHPPRFYSKSDFAEAEFDFEVQPGGPFSYDGKVAVLVDGFTISAGDYFARAVKLATDALLVGSPSAGAFGGGGAKLAYSSSPALEVSVDTARCEDGSGVALEGSAPIPDLVVEWSAADLAHGRDTILEAAVAKLLE